MFTSSSAVGLQFSTISSRSAADYSNVALEDQLTLKQWLELQKGIHEINALPFDKTAEHRRRA